MRFLLIPRWQTHDNNFATEHVLFISITFYIRLFYTGSFRENWVLLIKLYLDECYVGGKLLQGRIGKIRDIAEIVSHSSIPWDWMISSVKSSIHSVFQDFSRTRITFSRWKCILDCFLTVTYNLMYGKIAKASIILVLLPNLRNSKGHLKYGYFEDISKPKNWYWWWFDFSVFLGSPRSMGTLLLTS